MLAGLLALLWIEKFVHKCYKEDDKGDKFLSESCCDYGDDHERLLVQRDDNTRFLQLEWF